MGPGGVKLLVFSGGPRGHVPYTEVRLIRFLGSSKSTFGRGVFANPVRGRLGSILTCFGRDMVRRHMAGIPVRRGTGEYCGCPCRTVRRTITGTICRGSCSGHTPVRVEVCRGFVRVLDFRNPVPPVARDSLAGRQVSGEFCEGHEVNSFLGRLRLARNHSANFPGVCGRVEGGKSPRPGFRASRRGACFLAAFCVRPTFVGLSRMKGGIMRFYGAPESVHRVLARLKLSCRDGGVGGVVRPLGSTNIVGPARSSRRSGGGGCVSMMWGLLGIS